MVDGVKKRKEKGYTISAVSEAYGIHPQTLRLYERHGLLKPSRSKGNTRYYSEKDLERLEFILTLTRELGVNLAGVEIILNMRDKMDAMQREIQRFLEYLRMELGERLVSQVTEKFALVPLNYSAWLRARVSASESEDERDVSFTYIEHDQ